MKKTLLLFALLCLCAGLSAQRFPLDDTVVVFKLKILTPNGEVIKYVPYHTAQILRWTDKQYMAHMAVIREIHASYLLLNTTKVEPSDIDALVMTHLPISSLYATLKTRRVVSDSTGKFNIMSYYDFKNLIRANSYPFFSHSPTPYFKNTTNEKFVAKLEKKRQRRIQHYAALDTCPLRYGIKTNLVRDLINEINLIIELPVKRGFCIDVGGGVLYTRPDAVSGGYDRAFAQFPVLKAKDQYWFDHSYYNRKGFGIEVTPKFYLLKKKTLFIGPQLCFNYYHYLDKWVFNHDDGSDYYYHAIFDFQSEKSASVQLNAMFGVQTPPIKIFLFDAFVSFGVMYRGGTVSRTISKTVFSYYGTHIVNYDPPQTFQGGGFSLSGQIGLRLGLRFGKAKLFK